MAYRSYHSVLTICLILPISSTLVLTFTKVPKVIEIADKALHIYTYSVIGFSIFMISQGVFYCTWKNKSPFSYVNFKNMAIAVYFILVTQKLFGTLLYFLGKFIFKYIGRNNILYFSKSYRLEKRNKKL